MHTLPGDDPGLTWDCADNVGASCGVVSRLAVSVRASSPSPSPSPSSSAPEMLSGRVSLTTNVAGTETVALAASDAANSEGVSAGETSARDTVPLCAGSVSSYSVCACVNESVSMCSCVCVHV